MAPALYLHARNNNRAFLVQFGTVPYSYLFAGPGGELLLTYWQWHVALYDTGFPAMVWLSLFHAGLMMIQMVLGSMGMKELWYRW